MVSSKLKGNFYTPKVLAEWIVFYMSKYFTNNIDVLEPSCGDGVFIDALNNSSVNINNFDAVELELNAIERINLPNNIKKISLIHDDFLFWETDRKYDLTIGNPPYIVKKLLMKEQANACREIHVHHELLNYEVNNIWTSFILKSASFLKEDGVLALVLPTEILQVKYAKEIRSFLYNKFPRIELITFKHIAFDNLEQDTVVLFAYKNPIGKDNGVFIIEVDGIDNLANTIPDFVHLPTSSLDQKWTTGILNEADVLLVDELSSKTLKSSDYCVSVAGIVTAANNYFIVNKAVSEEYSLIPYCKNIIKKGFYVNGCIDFTTEKFESLKDNNTPCFLLDTNGVNNLSKNLTSYLEYGETLDLKNRYKCKLRKRWHDVPGIKKGEGFFFKRSHDYPKCIKNSADVYVTDSAYQIVMHENYTIENFIFSFYNSLTLLAAEMQGRFYGGGVLELTPNEFKNLPIPYTECENFTEFSNKFENKLSLDDILINNDKIILVEQLGLTTKEVEKLQLSYKKMKARRMRSK